LSEHTYDKHRRIFSQLFGTTSFDWVGFVEEELPNIDVDYLIAEIRRIKGIRYNIPVSFYPNFTEEEVRSYYTTFDFSPVSYPNRCLSPWMVAYVFPDGSVRPCLSLNYAAGSIRQDSFRGIWNNHAYTRFRSIIKQYKGFPVCTRCTEYYRF
jgi:radical SAM protein with 4Fe4S-binding SPASM domain